MSSGRCQDHPPQFRNIPLTPEIIAMGFTDIQVQAQNMVLRHQDDLILIAKYDMRDLTKTARLLESQLAEYVGKPQGLPEGFDPKAFSAMLSIALMIDIQDQFAQKQEQIREDEKRVNSMLDEIKELRDENADISFEQWQETLITKYNNLKNVVDKKCQRYGLVLSLACLV